MAIEGWVNRDDMLLLQQLGVDPDARAETGPLTRTTGSRGETRWASTKTASESSSCTQYDEVWNKENYDYARRDRLTPTSTTIRRRASSTSAAPAPTR